jgi:hypothetical protein
VFHRFSGFYALLISIVSRPIAFVRG